jgi:hypothetical protein
MYGIDNEKPIEYLTKEDLTQIIKSLLDSDNLLNKSKEDIFVDLQKRKDIIKNVNIVFEEREYFVVFEPCKQDPEHPDNQFMTVPTGEIDLIEIPLTKEIAELLVNPCHTFYNSFYNSFDRNTILRTFDDLKDKKWPKIMSYIQVDKNFN